VCARMAQFLELVGTPGADTAVLYWVPGVSPAYNWRTAIRYLVVPYTTPNEYLSNT
jgi:hypothetical protein